MIYRYNKIPENIKPYIGKKAFNLFELTKIGIYSPEWYIIPSIYFDNLYKDKRDMFISILKNKKSFEDINKLSKKLKNIIIEDEYLDKKIECDIINEIDYKIYPVSVRSSALNEDTEHLSFAGQYSTFLNIKDKNSIIHYIKKCLASQFNIQNLTYKILNKQDIEFQGIAIIIQKMILSEKSGILFTIDPVSGDKEKSVINASYGQGEGIVSDKVKSDMYVYDTVSKKFSKHIEFKTKKMDLCDDCGLIEKNIQNEKSNIPVLDDKELKELIKTGKRIENYFGSPQDIEFAYQNGHIYILQTRPITSKNGNKDILVWDNSNIVESFSGPTTPLTFSFANEAYSIIYKLMCLKLGVSKKVIKENEMLFTNMIGFINNRIYYSLNSWFTALSFLPAYKYNKEFMERMMGVKNSFEGKLINKDKNHSSLWGKLSLLKLIISITKSYFNHSRNVKRFRKIYNKAMMCYNDDIKQCTDSEEAINIYMNLKNKLLWEWITPVINDTFTMIFYGLLSKFLQKISKGEGEKLQNNLLSGEGNIESVEVTILLYQISNAIKKNNHALLLINEVSSGEFLNTIEKDNRFKDIYNLFCEYIDKYGNRCVHELKLEVQNLKDNPGKIIPLIKNYANKEELDIDNIIQREKDIRKEAENKVAKMLKRYNIIKRIFLRLIFNYLVKNTRLYVKNRENLRFIRTNVFGAVKNIFKKIGKEFYSKNIIDSEKDIFYLTVDEIISYIYGTSVMVNLKQVIAFRREEYKSNIDRDLPERFNSGYTPYINIPKKDVSVSTEGLKGIGCSPGHIKGVAEIVESPYIETAYGDILIAEKTDPGWLPVFPLYKGIILERGSVLSHSAIVARELGIPVIVGVRGLLSNIENGDMIEMNGSSGEINIINRRKTNGN